MIESWVILACASLVLIQNLWSMYELRVENRSLRAMVQSMLEERGISVDPEPENKSRKLSDEPVVLNAAHNRRVMKTIRDNGKRETNSRLYG